MPASASRGILAFRLDVGAWLAAGGGDVVIVSGAIGMHGIAVMSVREGLVDRAGLTGDEASAREVGANAHPVVPLGERHRDLPDVPAAAPVALPDDDRTVVIVPTGGPTRTRPPQSVVDDDATVVVPTGAPRTTAATSR